MYPYHRLGSKDGEKNRFFKGEDSLGSSLTATSSTSRLSLVGIKPRDRNISCQSKPPGSPRSTAVATDVAGHLWSMAPGVSCSDQSWRPKWLKTARWIRCSSRSWIPGQFNGREFELVAWLITKDGCFLIVSYTDGYFFPHVPTSTFFWPQRLSFDFDPKKLQHLLPNKRQAVGHGRSICPGVFATKAQYSRAGGSVFVDWG